MKKIAAALGLLASAPAWATMWCGPNISGTSTPACAAVNQATMQVVVKARDPADITQHFIVTPDGRVRSAVDGKCIGSRSATVTNPAEILQARACTSSLVTGDRWSFSRQAGATKHSVQSQLGSLLAGAVNDTPAVGSPLTMWSADGSTAQQWRFVDMPIPARSGETTARTMTLQSGALRYDGLSIPTTTELDCSVISGRYCKVPGSSPTRYARALMAAPGVTATEIAAITITTSGSAVTVATPTTISGSAIQGAALTATPATFSGCSGSVVVDWLKSGVVVATGASYTPVLGDVGAALQARSTGCSVVSTASTATVVAASSGGGGTSPNTNTVAFFSANYPPVRDGSMRGTHPPLGVNGLMCINNIWGFRDDYASAWQSVGCQAGSNGGVDIRMAISAPKASAAYVSANSEVTSYPEVYLGKTPSGDPASATTTLPKQLSALTSATIAQQGGTCNLTRGQWVTDGWITTTNGCATGSCRKVEIMWEYWPFGGYNAPAPWSKGGPGRTSDNIGGGPNEDGTYARVNINGETVDVYSRCTTAASGTTPATGACLPGQGWRLMKLFPMTFSKGNAHTLNFKHITDYVISQNWATTSDYLGAIEVGWEPVGDQGAVTGDCTMRGVKITTN